MTAALAVVPPLAEFVALPFECPTCGGEGTLTQCPSRCDGSHVMDTDAPCYRCDGEGLVAFADPTDTDAPEEIAA